MANGGVPVAVVGGCPGTIVSHAPSGAPVGYPTVMDKRVQIRKQFESPIVSNVVQISQCLFTSVICCQSVWSPPTIENIRLEAYHRIYPMYLDRQTWANSVDPDQTPQKRRLIWVCTVCHSTSNILNRSTGSGTDLYKL